MESGIYTSHEFEQKFHNLPIQNKVLIVNDNGGTISESLNIDIYDEDYCFGKLLFKDEKNGNGEYLNIDRFDYVNFLNSGKIQTNRLK